MSFVLAHKHMQRMNWLSTKLQVAVPSGYRRCSTGITPAGRKDISQEHSTRVSKAKTGCINLTFWGNVTSYAANDGKTSSCYVVHRLKGVTLFKSKHFVGQVLQQSWRDRRSSPVPVHHLWCSKCREARLSKGKREREQETLQEPILRDSNARKNFRKKLKTRIIAAGLRGKPGPHPSRKRSGPLQYLSFTALGMLA